MRRRRTESGTSVLEHALCYGSSMARPRTHNLDALLDAAQTLAADAGAAAVTVRALAEVTGVSNGAIYHAFGSRAGLLGRVWLRAATQFLAIQSEAVESALRPGETPQTAVDAIIAAADAPAEFSLVAPRRGHFLLTVRRRELLGDDDIPADIAEQLRTLDDQLGRLFVRLSNAMWGRSDRESVAVIKDCVVELPTALLLRGRRDPDPVTRARLAAAVRGVLSVELPAMTPSTRKATS